MDCLFFFSKFVSGISGCALILKELNAAWSDLMSLWYIMAIHLPECVQHFPPGGTTSPHNAINDYPPPHTHTHTPMSLPMHLHARTASCTQTHTHTHTWWRRSHHVPPCAQGDCTETSGRGCKEVKRLMPPSFIMTEAECRKARGGLQFLCRGGRKGGRKGREERKGGKGEKENCKKKKKRGRVQSK